jgi:hypothetical protein
LSGIAPKLASPFYRAEALAKADPLCSKLQSILAKANDTRSLYRKVFILKDREKIFFGGVC